MKKNDLVKIIELVVRKEVKKQMTEIFINEDKEISLSEVISKPKQKAKKRRVKKQYSKNRFKQYGRSIGLWKFRWKAR